MAHSQGEDAAVIRTTYANTNVQAADASSHNTITITITTTHVTKKDHRKLRCTNNEDEEEDDKSNQIKKDKRSLNRFYMGTLFSPISTNSHSLVALNRSIISKYLNEFFYANALNKLHILFQVFRI